MAYRFDPDELRRRLASYDEPPPAPDVPDEEEAAAKENAIRSLYRLRFGENLPVEEADWDKRTLRRVLEVTADVEGRPGDDEPRLITEERVLTRFPARHEEDPPPAPRDGELEDETFIFDRTSRDGFGRDRPPLKGEERPPHRLRDEPPSFFDDGPIRDPLARVLELEGIVAALVEAVLGARRFSTPKLTPDMVTSALRQRDITPPTYNGEVALRRLGFAMANDEEDDEDDDDR